MKSMLLFDAHLDLAMNALEKNGDVVRGEQASMHPGVASASENNFVFTLSGPVRDGFDLARFIGMHHEGNFAI